MRISSLNFLKGGYRRDSTGECTRFIIEGDPRSLEYDACAKTCCSVETCKNISVIQGLGLRVEGLNSLNGLSNG